MSANNWMPVREIRPMSGREVQVLTPGGDVRRLVFDGDLWWLPDRSMYVYFTPTHWRHLSTPAPAGLTRKDQA